MYSISEFAGLLVKQAREEKQWDQQYLADELDIDIRTLKKIEAGKSDISFDTLSSLIHLLEISPKILFYADRTETGVEMDKIFRQLMRFSPDNIQMICDSAHYIRAWKDANGDEPFGKVTDMVMTVIIRRLRVRGALELFGHLAEPAETRPVLHLLMILPYICSFSSS